MFCKAYELEKEIHCHQEAMGLIYERFVPVTSEKIIPAACIAAVAGGKVTD